MAGHDSAENEPFIADETITINLTTGGTETPEPTPTDGSPTAFIWALTFAAGISGLLFGYEWAPPSQKPDHFTSNT